jgi:hypothetical protein
MLTESGSTLPPRSSVSWLNARAFWAGVSITAMWLATLFVGLWGGNIISTTPGGTSTSVPVVIALVPFVLVATIAVAHSGLRASRDEQSAPATAPAPTSGQRGHPTVGVGHS